MKSGVYIITNLINGKNYIGESYYAVKKISQHRTSLRNKTHGNRHLQSSFNLYGEENFSFSILELCDESRTKELEDYWCNILSTHNDKFGYNIRLTDKEKMGRLSPQTKAKLSAAHKGKKLSDQHRANMAEAQRRRGKGQFRSSEAKFRVTTANVNRSRPILQFSTNGEFLREWISRRVASDTLNISYSAICNCTLGLSKSALGFVWKFKD